MNKSALKKYAPQARLDFIAAATRRAELLGLNPQSPAKVEKQGEALLINGQAFPAAYGGMRTTLEARIREQGFDQVMEAMAYTWFNRLVAIRYMELHGFLDHGYRVLSHPANEDTGHTQPEILDHIPELDLPDFDKEQALELKLAGNRDEELYREVLLAQCHALHKAMPFLFESLDDATELLLPDGLLRTDSILGTLVTAIDEADWQDVEIIGWLYQFYISEKKDQVIGKVVKSEDIPAATQLFTPNWIVKYLVQNSLGRLWLMANPASSLASKWEYYIQPAEQTPEVNAQLDALIQARIDEDGATLNPESLTLLDPACGSGHILVEAYDLLRDIYLERGYRRQDIPRLILEKNVYGLDIDDRAAQLAGFALLMKARADDRRLFGLPVGLNVLALQEAKAGSAAELHSALNAPQIDSAVVSQLVESFEQAKTFGSLIQISDELACALPELRRALETVRDGDDMLGRDAAETLLRLVVQAQALAKQFDTVVANPPYMGRRGMYAPVKRWAESNMPSHKADLYAMFVGRALLSLRVSGFVGMVTMQSWMFLSAFGNFRKHLLGDHRVDSFLHIGYNTFPELNSKVAQGCAFSIGSRQLKGFRGTYFDLNKSAPSSDKKSEFERCLDEGESHQVDQLSFSDIPGTPIAFWLSGGESAAFKAKPNMGSVCSTANGIQTGDNDKYVRCWWEVPINDIGAKWVLYNKGGPYRKWYGNVSHVIFWKNDGESVRNETNSSVSSDAYLFRCGLTWTDVTWQVSGRILQSDVLSDHAGPCAYFEDENDLMVALSVFNSPIGERWSNVLNPTLHFQAGDFKKLPYPKGIDKSVVAGLANKLIDISREDWDSKESSIDFKSGRLLIQAQGSLRASVERLIEMERWTFQEYLSAEQQIYELVSRAFDIPSDEKPPLRAENVALFCADALLDDLKSSPRRHQVSSELIGLSVGCMMGRYSLDAPGLIYAYAGNEGFDPSRYETFPADDDGIVPITDAAWFDDDGANRIREFVRVVWGEETEAENMAWLAESLGSKASESADDTIRRYLSRDFYKDHLQTYKKRPIYWLFSSGKNKAFEALVYLHRYNAGTLSRMRMEYVVPLQSRMQARIDNLDQDIQSSSSSAEQKRCQKQKDKLIKQLDELRRFDENLRHYADQRITLDLDDGVKVNYGKFGDLLAEVKAVTGKK